ncbi:DDE-1 domain-containing protein [Aphis craccivora]|uniref:DDE-1 domain-containing protein n=1 Tax=Aphis craccivora TaxID=307492 RepID=A0A6G0YHU0_APHCR|nr:DDE-1 domain-containing protein [Aphis craccivora]
MTRKKELLEDFSSDNELSDLDKSWQSSSHNADEPLALPLKNMAFISCVSDLKPGDYILVKFSTTNKRKESITEAKIKNGFKEMYELLGGDANILEVLNRIFYMDETCFNLALKGKLIIGARGQNVNVPLTLQYFKYGRIPAAFVKAAPPGWGIGKSETGWMTGEIFFEYITNIFLPFLNEANIQRPVIGHKSHLSLHLKFKRTYRGKYEWDRKAEASLLYTLWPSFFENINKQENESSIATVFNDVIKKPEQQQSKSSRKKEYTPSVIPSDK